MKVIVIGISRWYRNFQHRSWFDSLREEGASMIEANKMAMEISTPGQFRCEVEGQLQGRAKID